MHVRLNAACRYGPCWRAAVALGVMATCVSQPVAAQYGIFATPLPMNNRTPFTQVFIAPVAPDISQQTGSHQFSGHFDLSSHSLIETSANTQLELDGESLRVALNWQYRPAERWIVRAEIPWISHSGGFLDNVIDRWHDVTGLPEGERNRQPADRLLFGFQNDRQTLVTRRDQQSVGDIMFSTAFRLYETSLPPNPPAASGKISTEKRPHSSWIQLSVKLPTGRADSLSGSEATDVAVSFHHKRQLFHTRKPWSLGVDVYAIHAGQGKLIDTQKDTQWQLGLIAAVQWTSTIIPEVQLRYRSAAYASPVDALGGDSLGLDVGVTVHRNSGYWKLGISEDLDIDSAPDVGFYVQYTRR